MCQSKDVRQIQALDPRNSGGGSNNNNNNDDDDDGDDNNLLSIHSSLRFEKAFGSYNVGRQQWGRGVVASCVQRSYVGVRACLSFE
jgi:hypothetical protein